MMVINRDSCRCTETFKCYDVVSAVFYRDGARLNTPRRRLWCMIICAHRRHALPHHQWVQRLGWRFYEK